MIHADSQMLWIVLCTSRSISFSTYSMVRTFISPVCSSMYSSVRCVTVSPTTLSNSRTLVAPSLARRESFGKSSLEGRNVVRNYRADMGMGWLVTGLYVLMVTKLTLSTYNILLNSVIWVTDNLTRVQYNVYRRILQHTVHIYYPLLQTDQFLLHYFEFHEHCWKLRKYTLKFCCKRPTLKTVVVSAFLNIATAMCTVLWENSVVTLLLNKTSYSEGHHETDWLKQMTGWVGQGLTLAHIKQFHKPWKHFRMEI